MASINGWTMKGIKTFRGREWDGVQGNLYYNGKKVGTYDDYGDGGSAIITFTKEKEYRPLLQQAVKDYYAEHPLEGEFADITPDEELFVGDALLGLIYHEQEYKSAVFKGYPVLLIYTEFPGAALERAISFKTEVGADKYIANNNLSTYSKYTSLSDFVQ